MDWIIIDIGCIECGEQTEVKGIFKTKAAALSNAVKYAKSVGIDPENAKPRGGFLEFLGLHGKDETTLYSGSGYFSGGQHALEVHQFPARKLKAG